MRCRNYCSSTDPSPSVSISLMSSSILVSLRFSPSAPMSSLSSCVCGCGYFFGDLVAAVFVELLEDLPEVLDVLVVEFVVHVFFKYWIMRRSIIN